MEGHLSLKFFLKLGSGPAGRNPKSKSKDQSNPKTTSTTHMTALFESTISAITQQKKTVRSLKYGRELRCTAHFQMTFQASASVNSVCEDNNHKKISHIVPSSYIIFLPKIVEIRP